MIFCATFASVMTTVGYVIVALLLLMLMIVIHEFGHYSAGKLLKFKIKEFSIGFGPAIFKHTNKKNGELFAIRPIPLGGYCAFEGEDEDNKNPQAFNNQKPWKRIIVLFAGAFFNFISAIIIISIYFSCFGQMLPVITKVYDGTQSYQEAKFEVGDSILEVNGKKVHIVTQNDVGKYFKDTGETAEFKVYRNGKIVKIVCTKGDYDYDVLDKDTGKVVKTESGHGFGIQRTFKNTKLGYGLALGRSFSFCFYVVSVILATIGSIFTGGFNVKEAGGPITVISTITEASQYGFGNIMYLLVILSANLAVMNLLPLPALDGSRIVFAIIEWIRRKPINRKVEAIIHTVGIIILFSLTIILDIFHLI